ncbi:MAG: glycosyltransferase family 9 protein [Kiritimatiellia bacterium]
MKERILVIKHGALGDFVMASGRMRTVRERHPDAHIAVITEAFLRGLAEAMGFFDEIIVDPRGYSIATWWRVIVREIGARRWDAIYDLQSSNRTLCRYYPLALAATRHPLKWGRLAKGGLVWRVSSRKPPFFPWGFRNVFEAIAWAPKDLSMCHGEHRNFGLLPEKYALLIPGCSAGNGQKRWPAERYRELTAFFAAKGLKSVVMGTQAEAREINAICEGNADAVDFLGKSAIADIPDLANGAAVVVGNDTGPSHIAHIAGAKTVMLFTDYDFGRAAPKDQANVIALHGAKIADIPLESVRSALSRWL